MGLLRLDVGGSTQSFSVPASGGDYAGTKIASALQLNGNVDVQLTFLTQGIDVDFVEFVKY
jgi:hypothetical protein